jgi:hypothetical protein
MDEFVSTFTNRLDAKGGCPFLPRVLSVDVSTASIAARPSTARQ